MVKLKKQISIILILSFLLSLTPNFLYNGIEASDPCKDVSCPPCKTIDGKEVCCEKEYDKKTEHCVCINCPIPCEIETFTFTNKSCLPLKGTGEWACGKEIPIGEIMDRTAILASRILTEFKGMVEGGREMVTWGDRVLTDYKKWNCSGYTNWEGKEKKCETKCDKRYWITAGVLQPEESAPECSECSECIDYQGPYSESTGGKSVPPSGECLGCQNPDDCHRECKKCADYCKENKEKCCWPEEKEVKKEVEVTDPETGEVTRKTISRAVTCKYCKKEDEDGTKYCYEYCSVRSCRGCCSQYFGPVINGYTGIKELQKALKNDIKETGSPKKFKRSYILEQLDFARCELAQCWIPAGDYYDVLTGEKVGKHLLTCESVTQMGLFDDDQMACLVFQIINEWEEIIDRWEAMGEAPFWQQPLKFFEIVGKVIVTTGRILWGMIKEWTDTGQEEGCCPTNYYCCEL